MINIDKHTAPIQWYLVLSYLYYNKDISLVDDCVYDDLCKYIYDNWDTIEHQHKYILDRESIGRAGTGFYITKYPQRVIGAALNLIDSL